MPIMFADLVPAELDRSKLMLARHHTNQLRRGNTPYDAWRTDVAKFELYQRCQASAVFQHAKNIASFVVSPIGETIFVGVYANEGLIEPPNDLVEPLTDWEIGQEATRFFYQLHKTDVMSEYVGRLIIEWGAGALAWVQYETRNPKAIVQLRQSFEEEPFPGFANFFQTLSEIGTLPASWIPRLRDAKGIYVLSCPKTRELYVGSATGEGGFYERWRQHAKAGGDAKMLQSREPSDYQVTIVEVAGSSASRQDILHAEHLWMRKLQTNEMGLNGGMLRDGKEKPVTSSASPTSATHP